MNAVDLSAFGWCDSWLGHWDGRIDAEGFFDDCIEIWKFIHRPKGRYAGAIVLQSLEFISKFLLNMLETRTGDLPDKISECLGCCV